MREARRIERLERVMVNSTCLSWVESVAHGGDAVATAGKGGVRLVLAEGIFELGASIRRDLSWVDVENYGMKTTTSRDRGPSTPFTTALTR